MTRYREPDLRDDGFEDEESTGETTMRLPSRPPRPVPRQAIPTLRVVAGRDMLRFATIQPGEELVLGRDESSGLRLNDLTVSKRHARLTMDDGGAISVHDLGSTNGTAVNGRPVRRTALRTGDHLEVGGASLRLDLLSPDELGHLSRVVDRLAAAHRDPLTGLNSRAFLDDDLPRLAEHCDRAGVPFSCAFVDVDHFKDINDTHGHQAGDEVLAGVSRILMLGVRDADPCVRYGGEEILMFLPGSTETSAAEVAERLRRAIAGHDWARTAARLRVTACFGVAQRAPGESLKQWIDRADQAVYAAKRAGRNRVECAGRRSLR